MEVVELIAYILIAIVGSFLCFLLTLKLINRSCYGKEVTANARQDPTVKTDQLRFLLYNVKWRPSIARRGSNEYANERAEILANQLLNSNYDVICLNEAYSYIGSPTVPFIKKMKEKGYVYCKRLPPTTIFSFEVIDSGVVVLSKYPILATDSLTYELNVGGDMMIAKGMLYVRIQTGPGTHCHVFATHLQANHKGSYQECKTVRFSQLYAYVSLLKRKATDGQPVILIGDLNVNAFAPKSSESSKALTEYNRLIKTISIDSFTLTDALYHSEGSHQITYGIPDEKKLTPKDDLNSRQCTDYIFVYSRDDGQYVVDECDCNVTKFTVDGNKNFTQLSDHYGLSCNIRFYLIQNNA